MSDTEMLAVLNPDAFVTHMYETVFGRAPDAEGFAWWVDQLESGSRDFAQVAVEMTQSNEFVELTAIDALDYLLG